MKYLETTSAESDSFPIAGRAQIILITAVPTADWNIQVKPIGSADDAWVNDGDVITMSTLSVAWEGSEDFEYRINLGTGNEGPEGHVGSIRSQVFPGGKQ